METYCAPIAARFWERPSQSSKKSQALLAVNMPVGVPAPGPWDLPGDNSSLSNEGLAEGESIWVRLATIVRARRLDLRLLMDACDLHNRGM